MEQFPELFKGLGKLKTAIKSSYEKERHLLPSTSRRIPIPLLPKVKEELHQMESMAVNTRIDEPMEWCGRAQTWRKSENLCRSHQVE